MKQKRQVHWVAVLFVVLVATWIIYLLARVMPDKTKWAVVSGAVRGTKVVPEQAIETKWGAEVKWQAQYQVVYLVNGHEYTVWTDSRIRGDSRGEVEMNLPKIPPACRVRYEIRRPDIAAVECR